MEDVVGKTYGLLTVLAETERVGTQRRVLVTCSCEASTEKVVQLGNLRSGNTTSCGCVRKASAKVRSTVHGLRQLPLYPTWKEMIRRCQDQNHKSYKDYGGRGIAVCERWQKFENFYADMQPTHKEGLTLDRKDNDQGYSLENCRWATKAEQSRNKRNNINATLHGKTQCLKDWCRELDVKYLTIYTRVQKGQTPEQALLSSKAKTRVAEFVSGAEIQ